MAELGISYYLPILFGFNNYLLSDWEKRIPKGRCELFNLNL